MISRRAFSNWNIARRTVSRSLRLLALLLLVVILRTVQTDGDQTFIAVLTLIGVATLAGALFLRRRRNRETRPPVRDHIDETIPTRPALGNGAGAGKTMRSRNAGTLASSRTPAALILTSKCL